MENKETKQICEYCGKPFFNKARQIYMCGNCQKKLVLVRELCAIGRKIKRSAGK